MKSIFYLIVGIIILTIPFGTVKIVIDKTNIAVGIFYILIFYFVGLYLMTVAF